MCLSMSLGLTSMIRSCFAKFLCNRHSISRIALNSRHLSSVRPPSVQPSSSGALMKRTISQALSSSESTSPVSHHMSDQASPRISFPYLSHPHLDQRPVAPFPLTVNERALFETILAACAEVPELNSVTVRAAGGWVRDKLLGLHSHDCDIAVDCITGARFAELLIAYVHSRLDGEGCRASGVGVIKRNPEQSKHLETATFVLFGISIDCVALRSETYADNSRIPTTAMGTPTEDAQRRDFTFNALFLNVQSQSVEDLCGTGIDDLRAGLIRTPLPPLQTFADDPLRVLRAVRFASRFGFAMHQELREAAASPIVRAAFSKVSRERYGIELLKMLTPPSRSADALQTLIDFHIHDIVFALPPAETIEPAFHSFITDSVYALRVQDLARSPLSFVAPGSKSDVGSRYYSETQHRDSHLAAFLVPLHGHVMRVKPTKTVPLAWHVIMASIKFKTEVAENVCSLLDVSHRLLALIKRVNQLNQSNASAVESTPSLSFAEFLNRNSATDFTNSSSYAHEVMWSPLAVNDSTDASLIASDVRAAEDSVLTQSFRQFGAWARPEIRVELGQILRLTRDRWPQYLDFALVLLNHDSVQSMSISATMNWPSAYAEFRQCFQWIQSDLSSLADCWNWTPFCKGDELMRRFDVRGAAIMSVLDRQMEWRMQNAWRFSVPTVSTNSDSLMQTPRHDALKAVCVRFATQGLTPK